MREPHCVSVTARATTNKLTNYILRGEVIKAATGKAWHEVLHQRVLDPLGLERTLLPTDGNAPVLATGSNSPMRSERPANAAIE